MNCDFCCEEFEEKDMHESHDVPCYLFSGNRKGRKNQADKFGRHWLCKECHDRYEEEINYILKECAKIESIKIAEAIIILNGVRHDN